MNTASKQDFARLNVHLLGRRITCMTAQAILDEIFCSCIEKKKIVVSSYNVHSFNLSMQLPWLYDFQQSADIAMNDSMGLLIALRWLGVDLPIEQRVSYTLLTPRLLEMCNTQALSLFLLGSRPDVLLQAQQNIRNHYPRILLSGHHGHFDMTDPEQNQAIVSKINQFQTQILLVAMGMPRQEQWVVEHQPNLNVNVLMSSGGAIIDRLAGMVPDCPEWLSNLGLEWFFRLCLEPRRLSMRYLLGNPAFFLQIALARSLHLQDDLVQIDRAVLPVETLPVEIKT